MSKELKAFYECKCIPFSWLKVIAVKGYSTSDFLVRLESNFDQFSASEILDHYQINSSDFNLEAFELPALDSYLMRLIDAIKNNKELKERLFYPTIEQVIDHILKFIYNENFPKEISFIAEKIGGACMMLPVNDLAVFLSISSVI